MIIQWVLHGIKEDYELCDEERRRILDFEQRYYNEQFITRLTTREDIDDANEFVDFLLAMLRAR